MAKISFKNIGSIFKTTFKKWNEKDPFKESAVIAYYAIFSLPGLLVVIITVAGFFLDDAGASVRGQIAGTMGPDTADQVNDMIAKAGDAKTSLIAGIIGVFTIILGATGVFAQLQKALNIIWEVEVKKTSGIKMFLKTRIFSFGLIVSIAFLLLVSLVLSSVLASFGDWVKARFPDIIMVLFVVLNLLVSFGIITLLFALMFKILPDAKIKWKDVWIGAMLTALLFILGKEALGIYFGKAEPGSDYGAAGSIILILLWCSYSSMILFFGAEFTKVYSERHSGEIKPTENAVKAPGRKV